jgi:hypothetical protein
MARGRFVSKAISLDEKVNALSNDTIRLLFTWLILHLDCEERIMQVNKNVFVDIHFDNNEEGKARKLAREYEDRGYSLESEDENFIQLLKTYILKER